MIVWPGKQDIVWDGASTNHSSRDSVDIIGLIAGSLNTLQVMNCSNVKSRAPVEDLPFEILGKIFTLCLPDDLYIELNPRNAPLLLLQICRFWRDTAISTEQLWRSLTFHVAEGGHVSSSYHKLAQGCLARSGAGPLRLQFRTTGTSRKPSVQYTPLYRILPCSQEVHRCVSLCLVLPFEELEELEGMAAPSLPLSLRAPSGFDPANPQELLQRPMYRLYQKLTELVLDDIDLPDRCLDVLTWCPNLLSCTLRFSESSDYEAIESAAHKINLHALHHLEIDISLGCVDDVLLTLTLPCLRSLTLTVNGMISPWGLLSLLKQSQCSLRELSIKGMRAFFDSRDDLDELLTLVPDLTYLELEGEADEDWIGLEAFDILEGTNIDVLAFDPPNNRRPLPLLESLRFASPSHDLPEAGAIQEMLLSRVLRSPNEPDPALRSARIVVLMEDTVHVWSYEQEHGHVTESEYERTEYPG